MIVSSELSGRVVVNVKKSEVGRYVSSDWFVETAPGHGRGWESRVHAWLCDCPQARAWSHQVCLWRLQCWLVVAKITRMRCMACYLPGFLRSTRWRLVTFASR
jgi:hypothetical protein